MAQFPEYIQNHLNIDRKYYSLDSMENIEKAKQDSVYLGDVMLVNEKLIWHSVHRYVGKPSQIVQSYSIDKHDIIQLGRIGFIKAIKAFDTTRGIRFSSFAVTAIVREVRCFLRDSARMIRPTRAAHDLMNKIRMIENELDYLPSAAELSDLLDTSSENVTKALTIGKQITYLDEPCRNNKQSKGTESDAAMIDLIEDSSLNVEQEVVDRVFIESMIESLKDLLNDLEREVFRLRVSGLNQTQIAEQKGISQMKVSRVMKKVSNTLREHGMLPR
jgi:RNA polymerase sigma factor (sigma-70 family)